MKYEFSLDYDFFSISEGLLLFSTTSSKQITNLAVQNNHVNFLILDRLIQI